MEELLLRTAKSPVSSISSSVKTTPCSGQTPNAGWANRLLQEGFSDHETKTNGCFGGAGFCGLSASNVQLNRCYWTMHEPGELTRSDPYA